MLKDFALEDPDLDAARAVGRVGRRRAVIHIRAQRMQRHATLAVPFEARDFGAAETAGAVDADAFGPETHGRLHGALHGATEGDTTLELLGDGIGHQGRVHFRLAHFDDVDRHVGVRHLVDELAQLLDVGALFADHHARTSRVDGDAALLVRALDDDLRNGSLLELLHEGIADRHVLMHQLGVLALAGEPARVPGPVDAEPKTDRVNFLTHLVLLYACCSAATSRTTIVRFENGFMIRAPRPRARAWKRFMTSALPTKAWLTTRSSTSRLWLFSALAMALCRHFLTSRAIRLRENSRSASAVETFLPRMSAATRLSF